MRASTVSTAAICTKWVTTFCMSTVYVSDVGSYITLQLSDRSLTRSVCLFCVLAGAGGQRWLGEKGM